MRLAPVLLGDELVLCEAGALTRPDLATVDALARLALAARRTGRRTRVRHASAALKYLLDLAGLADVVRCEA